MDVRTFFIDRVNFFRFLTTVSILSVDKFGDFVVPVQPRNEKPDIWIFHRSCFHDFGDLVLALVEFEVLFVSEAVG